MKSFIYFLPETLLLLTLAGVILGEVSHQGEKVRLAAMTALVGLGAAMVHVLLTYQVGSTKIFDQNIVIDGVSRFFKLFFIILSSLIVVVSLYAKEVLSNRRTEYYAFIVASALAMCLVASSANLLIVFLSLQFLNILAYFMAGYSKENRISTEAAVKYLVFSVVSGAFFLYAVSILFYYARTLNLYEIYQVLQTNPLPHATGLIVFGLLFLSLCFYLGVFPVYLWVADVLEGSPGPSSIFLGVGIPAAGFSVALRFFFVLFGQSGGVDAEPSILGNVAWTEIVAVAAGATMLIGSFLSIRQSGIRRLLACLIITQSGFLLCGLLVLDAVGISALLYNLLVQLFSVVGVYCAMTIIVDHIKTDQMTRFKGVLSQATLESIFLLVFLACLVGLPPFPGFVGRFVLAGAVLRNGWYGLVLVGVLSSVLMIAAFSRVAYQMAGEFDQKAPRSSEKKLSQRVFLCLLLIPISFLSFFADPVLRWASQSVRFIFW